MNTVGVGATAALANLVAPFNPVGKQAVGLENAQAKEDSLSPVEEPAKAGEPFNRDDKPPGELSESNRSAKPVAGQEQGNEEQRRLNVNSQNEADAQEQQELQNRQLISELAARDREVRAHEQAHAGVGGQYAGSPSFTFQRGPDGVNYAVGGEVPISLPSSGSDPRAALVAAEQVRRAALAPAEPSAQDRKVAAQARQVTLQARSDIVQLSNEQKQEKIEQAESKKAEQREIEEEQLRTQQTKDEENRQEQVRGESRRRALELGDQLVTVDNVEGDQSVGSFIDQKA